MNGLGKFCAACQAIPSGGFCNLAGCPSAPLDASAVVANVPPERMKLAPITVKAALKQVRAWHRHLPELQGGLFAVQLVAPDSVFDGTLHCVGVGVAGNPSQVWQGTGRIVISRCAITEGLPKVIDSSGVEHAAPGCTLVYNALARAAQALGYREVWTYTLPDEDGRSVKAAGFTDMGLTDGGEWSRPSRQRSAAVCSQPKRRWLRPLNRAAAKALADELKRRADGDAVPGTTPKEAS